MHEVKMAGRWKAKYMFSEFMVQKKNGTNIQPFDQTSLVNREFNTWTKNSCETQWTIPYRQDSMTLSAWNGQLQGRIQFISLAHGASHVISELLLKPI